MQLQPRNALPKIMLARYYGASLGRFLSSDPIDGTLREPQSWNRYAYVDNNPLVFIDPTGMYGINPNPYNPKGTNPCDGMGPMCTEGSKENEEKREKIDETARGYDGSDQWAKDKKKDDFPAGTWKCNKFCNDVVEEAGAEAKVTVGETERGPLAAEWADPDTEIPNWRPLKPGETPQPGDVGAYKLPGGGAAFSGHAGFIVSDGAGGTTNISAHADKVYAIPGQFETNPNTVYRRYTGD